MGRLSDTTSDYMYESEAMQSIEERVHDRITTINNKFDMKIFDLDNEFKKKIDELSNELKQKEIELNTLIEYIKLPWYKKLFLNFDKYERNL